MSVARKRRRLRAWTRYWGRWQQYPGVVCSPGIERAHRRLDYIASRVWWP